MLDLVKNLEVENQKRLETNYSLHDNKTTHKAALTYKVTNTAMAHIANGYKTLDAELTSGTLVKNIKLKTNSKLDGIPTIGFPNIFIQSTFMRFYQLNEDQLTNVHSSEACEILMDYFQTHSVCHNCTRCSGLCYNNKFETQYPAKAISELRILLAYIVDRQGLAAKIIKTAKKSKSGYFRINSNGEIHSLEMINFWVDIAAQCPEIEFYSYTKSFELFEEYLSSNTLPSNLHINMSVIEGQEEYLSKFDQLYSGNKFKMVTEIPEDSTTTCTGNCSTCDRLCMRELPKDNNTIYCKYHN